MCLYSLIFQTVSVCAFCAVWGTQVLQAGNRCLPGFCGCFLFCSFSGVILAPESAWRCPPSHPHPLRWQERIPVRCAFMRPCQFRACGRRAHGVIHPPRRWQIKSVEGCREYKLTNHSLSLIILGIEVGTEKCWAHMIKNISKYPAWHR